jgi:hypothetical protein
LKKGRGCPFHAAGEKQSACHTAEGTEPLRGPEISTPPAGKSPREPGKMTSAFWSPLRGLPQSPKH